MCKASGLHPRNPTTRQHRCLVLTGVSQVVSEVVKRTSIAAIFLLAGIPEGLELLFKLLVGDIDTHVLMTLAAFGTLAIGAAMEVQSTKP